MKRPIILILFLGIFIGMLNASVNSHHVIILLDRSAGMQPATSHAEDLNEIFDQLSAICFSRTDSSVGRQLLNPECDRVTLLTFGMDSTQVGMQHYIQHADYVHGRYLNYGYINESDFDSNMIQEFQINISENGYRSTGTLFNKHYGILSAAIPVALNSLGENDPKADRVFIIFVSDRKHNVDESNISYTHELDQPFIDRMIGSDDVIRLYSNILSHYDIKIIEGLSHEVQRIGKLKSYQGKKYHIDTSELIPHTEGLSAESLIEYKVPYILGREPHKYVGFLEYNILAEAQTKIQPIMIVNSYSINDSLVLVDSLKELTKSNTFHTTLSIENVASTDRLLLSSSVSAEFKNAIFKGVNITSARFPRLNKKIAISVEEEALIFNVLPLSDLMYWLISRGNDQSKSAKIYETILYVIFIFMVVLVFIIGVRRMSMKPQKVIINQFKIQ